MISFSNKETTRKLIEIEKNSLKATLLIQKSFNKQILTFLKTFMEGVEIDFEYDLENSIYTLLNDANVNLKKTNKNIKKLNKKIEKLQKIDEIIPKKTVALIKEELEEYNKEFSSSINSVYKNNESIEKFIFEISSKDISKLYLEVTKKAKKSKKKLSSPNIKSSITKKDLDDSFIENTLIISEISKKVFLPYTIEELKNILLDDTNNYTSIKEIIDKKFTVPIKRFSPSPISRWKEAYNLAVNKEHLSKLKGLSLANELFFNYSLHPAIIAACKTIDELDIYLACLEDNCLDDFKYFDIKFEIPPQIVAEEKIRT